MCFKHVYVIKINNIFVSVWKYPGKFAVFIFVKLLDHASRCWLYCLGSLVYLFPNFLKYVAFQRFDLHIPDEG